MADKIARRNTIIFAGVFNFNDAKVFGPDNRLLKDNFKPWYADNGDDEEKRDAEKRWKYNKAFYDYIRSYFYPGFNNIIFPERALFRGEESNNSMEEDLDKYLKTARECAHFTLKDISPFQYIEVQKGEKPSVFVERADVHCYHGGIGIFCLNARVTNGGGNSPVSFKMISDAVNVIREPVPGPDAIKIKSSGESIAIPEIVNKYLLAFSGKERCWDLNEDMNFNNKLKSFIICEWPVGGEADQKEENDLLYELGTVSRIGTMAEHGFNSPSKEYMDDLMKNRKISLFNNWSALSLFDTFTVLIRVDNKGDFGKGSGFGPYDNSRNIYIHLFIHALYLKYMLYDFNYKMSLIPASDRQNHRLRDRFITTRNRNYMKHVSYNFLPNQLYQKMLESYNLADEMEMLQERIEGINGLITEKSEMTMSFILLILAVITSLTAIYNFAQWFRDWLKVDEKMFFNLNLTLTILIPVVLIFLVFYNNRKNGLSDSGEIKNRKGKKRM